MPKIKSAIKRVKTSNKSHLRNISYKSKIKSSIKKYNLALSEKNNEEASKYFKDSVSILDKSVNKGILPKNAASRQKAILTKKLNALAVPEATEKVTSATPKEVEKIHEKPVVEKTPKVAKQPAAKKPAAKKVKKTAKKTDTAKTKTDKIKS
jgi:small subunit ribosomal protein S20